MHIEDSPLERTPDLIAKIRALREQAEQQMNQFIHPDDYDVRRVTGRKPKSETVGPMVPNPSKKKPGRKPEQASIDFASAPAEQRAHDGDEV